MKSDIKQCYVVAYKTYYKTGVAFVPLGVSRPTALEIVRKALGLITNVETYIIGILDNPDLSMLANTDFYYDDKCIPCELPVTIYFIEGET